MKQIVVLALAVLISSPAWADDPANAGVSSSAAAQSADQLYSAWETNNRTNHELARMAGKDFVARFANDPRAAKVQKWVNTYEKIAASGTVQMPSQTFRDCPNCPEMVIVPAGNFMMGSPGGEAGRSDDEGPMHNVTVGQYSMGKYEVTVGEFRRFIQATQYQTDAERNAGGVSGCYAMDVSDGKWDWRAGLHWNNPGFSQTDRQPAVCVSWNDAQAYVQWLAKATGKKYRLPSEAEWEYAARGNTGTARYWGDNPNDACRYANVADQSKGPGAYANGFGVKHECNDGYFFTAPVGSFVPNAFGLYDMIGNAWEWVEDSYHDRYNGAPTDGSAWQGDGAKRVLRGGSWNYGSPQDARAAFRIRFGAAFRISGFGFRLARTLP